MKTLIAGVALALSAVGLAPTAQADDFSSDEIDFLNNVAAIGVVNSGGSSDVVESGWMICVAIYEGYSRPWIAQQIYLGSQEFNGAAGISYQKAQALVFYANSDLCPGVGA